MDFAPPPPDFTDVGPLSTVAAKLDDHIALERRRSWDVALSDLGVSPDGKLYARGHAPVVLERGGFDAVLKTATACFPRAPTLLSRVSPALFAAVWAELFDPAADGMPLDVKVRERGCGAGSLTRAVWGTAPVSYPETYHVGRLAVGLAEHLDGMALVSYTAADSRLVLTLVYPTYRVHIEATDVYDSGGASVTVHTPDGRDLGDPLPGIKNRRRAASTGDTGSTVVDGIVAKVRAAPAFVKSNPTPPK